MRIPESELIINDDGSVFHIHLRPEEIADRIIMVGDPGRVDMIAESCFPQWDTHFSSLLR
jgi:uridine phosphorylase